MQLSPQTIRKLSKGDKPLITPIREAYMHHTSGLSGGLSCAGYDVHLADITVIGNASLSAPAQDDEPEYIVLLPGQCSLGVTEEKFHLPNDLCMLYINKSTLAREFIDASATLAEPGWTGHLTLEIKNNSDISRFIQIGQPIGQVVFHRLDEPTERPYSGKYQNANAKPQEAL